MRELALIEIFIGFFVSLFAGLVGSMVGVGGGIVNGPFLSLLNYLPSQISATSLMAVFSTSISSSIQFMRKGFVVKKVGIILAISSIPGTFIGVHFANIFSMEQFRYLFAVILLGTAIYLFLRKRIYSTYDSKLPFNFNSVHLSIRNLRLLVLVSLSFIAGIVSSSFGVGGGIIFVPCLIVIMKFNVKNSTATSQFALIFTSISGLMLFMLQGRPDYQMGFILSIGAVIGGTLGSLLSMRVNSSFILKLFSGLLVIVSLKLLYDGVVLQN
jgi:uncharacterized membrane protein YfcA